MPGNGECLTPIPLPARLLSTQGEALAWFKHISDLLLYLGFRKYLTLLRILLRSYSLSQLRYSQLIKVVYIN